MAGPMAHHGLIAHGTWQSAMAPGPWLLLLLLLLLLMLMLL